MLKNGQKEDLYKLIKDFDRINDSKDIWTVKNIIKEALESKNYDVAITMVTVNRALNFTYSAIENVRDILNDELLGNKDKQNFIIASIKRIKKDGTFITNMQMYNMLEEYKENNIPDKNINNMISKLLDEYNKY